MTVVTEESFTNGFEEDHTTLWMVKSKCFFNKTLSTSNIKEKYMFSALSFCYLSSSCVMEINQNKEKLG